MARRRLAEYYDKTAVVANHYKQFNKVVELNGEGTVEDVFALLAKEIDSRMKQAED